MRSKCQQDVRKGRFETTIGRAPSRGTFVSTNKIPKPKLARSVEVSICVHPSNRFSPLDCRRSEWSGFWLRDLICENGSRLLCHGGSLCYFPHWGTLGKATMPGITFPLPFTVQVKKHFDFVTFYDGMGDLRGLHSMHAKDEKKMCLFCNAANAGDPQ